MIYLGDPANLHLKLFSHFKYGNNNKKDIAQFYLILGSFNTWSSVETNKETKEGQVESRFL